MKNKVEHRKISEFTTDPRNANAGSERGLRVLDDSIAETGLGRSVVADKNGIIIGGNKTTERSIDRGFDDAIVVHTDGKQLVIVQRDDLDLSDPDPNNAARKMAYFDNRTSELSLNWDANVIAADVEAGVDLSGMFSQSELDAIMQLTQSVDVDSSPIDITSQYLIMIECAGEKEQGSLLERLIEQGVKCRALVS